VFPLKLGRGPASRGDAVLIRGLPPSNGRLLISWPTRESHTSYTTPDNSPVSIQPAPSTSHSSSTHTILLEAASIFCMTREMSQAPHGGANMAALTPDLDGDSGAEDAPLRYTSTSGPRYPPSTGKPSPAMTLYLIALRAESAARTLTSHIATFAHAQDYRYPTQPPQAHNRRTGALRFILNPPTSAMDHQTPDARPKWEPPATALAGAPSGT
jgi:hypothetical protein